MSEKPIEKRFLSFVVPSMLTMLLNGFYTMVDGFFIGQSVGDVGLAGIGLAWPVAAVLLAVGVGIGAGGSVILSTHRGAGDSQMAGEAQANTLLLLIAAGIVTTSVLLPSYPAIVRWLGAEGEVCTAAAEYTRIIAFGSCAQILGTGLTPILRNNHHTVQAMLIMCGGLVTNIVLDAWFLPGLGMGLPGAALATVIAQGVTALLCAVSLVCEKKYRFRRGCLRFRPRLMLRILLVGISPFGLSLMPSLISMFNNWQCLAYGGDAAVAAYCVSNYLIGALMLLLQGVGDGLQPLVSFCVGGGLEASRRTLQRKGVLLVLAMSAAFLLLSFPLRELLPPLFGTSIQTAAVISGALPILCAAFPMMGLVKLYISYFYASGHSRAAVLLVYADPLLLTPLTLWLLPRWLGLEGVWLSLPAAQAGLFLILLLLLRRAARKKKCPNGKWMKSRAEAISAFPIRRA